MAKRLVYTYNEPPSGTKTLIIPIQDLLAIDIHAHYGVYDRASSAELISRFMSGDAETVAARARAAGIEWTVVSPLLGLMPRGKADAAAGNEEAVRVVDQTTGLLQWVVVNPLQPETFDQARERLIQPKCMGIKIHPEEHDYKIAEQGEALFEFAARFDAVILAHSGQENSRPADYITFADAFANVTLILGHLGNADGADVLDLQVRAIQAAKHNNVFTDTSSSRSLFAGLIEWAVGEVGAEHVLFGTDSPLYFTHSQRARIDHAELTDEQKRMILRGNAERLLRLPE